MNHVLVDVGPDHYARLEAVEMFTWLDASRERGQAVGHARRAGERGRSEGDAADL
ncbi:MAG: hypothetical protein ABI833_23110 [Acidobacteriota bacterium]